MNTRELRSLNIVNFYDVLTYWHTKGGASKTKCVAVYYIPSVPRMVRPSHSLVYSPYFKTNKKAHWTNYGMMSFTGLREESLPLALDWASRRYAILDWSTLFRGYIPAECKKWLKQYVKENT